MAANPVKPRAAQGGLFVPAAPEPVKLELTLARIRAIVGEDRAGVVAVLNTTGRTRSRWRDFRPGDPLWNGSGARRKAAAQPTRAALQTCLGYRMFRPPRAARVTIAASHPTFVAADSIRGNVVESAGRWRTSGDWWMAEPWSRDEWDIALSDGGLYRVYCCLHGWFVEGSYD